MLKNGSTKKLYTEKKPDVKKNNISSISIPISPQLAHRSLYEKPSIKSKRFYFFGGKGGKHISKKHKYVKRALRQTKKRGAPKR